MNKFSDWLSANRRMAVALARRLGIHKSTVTNAKTGLIAVPQRWMPVIEEMSKGRVTVRDLVDSNNARGALREIRE